MRELVECFLTYLKSQRSENLARELALALANETLKRITSSDAIQRTFDAQELADAAGWNDSDEFEAIKRKVNGARLLTFIEARRPQIEDHFTTAGYKQALKVSVDSPPGRHRKKWFLEPYDIVAAISPYPNEHLPQTEDEKSVITYDYTAAASIRPSWLGRLFLGGDRFPTRSLRGLMFGSTFFVALGFVMLIGLVAWLMTFQARPVQTGDLASLVCLGASAWAVYVLIMRPYLWLLEDRLIPASEILVSWKEHPAQVEFTRQNGELFLGLVRYHGTCPICAGKIELRYGFGTEQRRLFGCCVDAPREHVWTFDRVTRRGRLAH